MGLEKERALTMQEIKKHKGEDVKSLYIYIMLKQNEDNGGREIVKIWRTEREKKGRKLGFIYILLHICDRGCKEYIQNQNTPSDRKLLLYPTRYKRPDLLNEKKLCVSTMPKQP